MGGKAKCPHCLLELEFDGSGSASAEDRAHDVTRADDREHRMSYDAAADEAVEADESDEVDSHCPACERRYKVDRKYLELGGAAQCPHCAVDLIFDSTGAPADAPVGEPGDWEVEPTDKVADEWGESGEISLPELDELRVPTAVEEPPAEEPPVEEPAAEEAAEPEDDYADEDRADELPTVMMEGKPSVELEEGLEDQAEEPAPGVEEPQVGLAEELFGDSAGEESVEAEPEEPSEPEAESPVVLEEGQSEPDGPFGALASNQDWAASAARWAESGFKADEMPSFIKGEGEDLAGGQEALEEPDTRPTEAEPPVGGELLIAEAAADSIEVSDADIMLLEASEADILPESAPAEAGPSWAEAASREVEAKRVKKPPMAKAERVAKEPSLFSKLKSPWVIAGVLGGVVVLTVALLWVFMGGGEDVAAYQFPSKGLKAKVVKAPVPSAYKAKDEAIEHYGLGNRLAYQGKWEDAILEYKQALRLDPGYPHPHRALGSVYAALGKPKLSAASYLTYLRLSPHSADALQVRGIVKGSGEK
jgi:tetratricopeptide (TPR) repeat protein